MQRLVSIRRLKDVGFSLDEIWELFESSTHEPSENQLDAKIRACEEELGILQKRLVNLHLMSESQRNVKNMEKFSIQSLPEIIVASHREVLKNYQAIGEMCYNVIGPYDRFYQSYAEMFKYIEEQGYKIVGNLRCVYVDSAWNQEDPEKWVSIIQVPVEK